MEVIHIADSKNEKNKGAEQEKKNQPLSSTEASKVIEAVTESELLSKDDNNTEPSSGKTGSAAAEPQVMTGYDDDRSLVDIMYDKIDEVIGGDNPNQYFCMTFPATLLAKESYAYDYKNGKTKPLTVEAKESRLANKMFDSCKITGADNGRSLAQQYSSALDMLTPKLKKNSGCKSQPLRRISKNLICNPIQIRLR